MNLQWIPGFMLLAVLIGAVATFGLASIDLLNPVTSQAKAERMSIETRHLAAMNRLEEQLIAAKTERTIARIRHEMAVEEARYQAELARIAADQAYYERMLNLKGMAFEGVIMIALILGGVGGMSLIIVKAKIALARVPANSVAPFPSVIRQPSPKPTHRYPSNRYKQERINARQRELFDRYIMLKRVCVACNGNNMPPQRYKNLPLAAD